MAQKLDLEREIVTLNGRALRLVSQTTDGRLVLQAVKSRIIVVVDEFGQAEGKDYAINRDALKGRQVGHRTLASLTPGQTVYCFRFSKRQPCLLSALYVGEIGKGGNYCKLVPVEPSPAARS